MAIDPFLPLERHSVEDLVAEIGRLNQVCFAHEQAREHLEQEIARLVQEDEESDRSELSGFLFGVMVCLMGFVAYLVLWR
ncbi:hypothetical protein [Glycomyces rhizosphaerae]|uniref:Uncharacterized protein n=1 Tax=Glycomyces rhizosphaerae TaxID=2054422 RepID=A0ABV7Q0R9_9ACTN